MFESLLGWLIPHYWPSNSVWNAIGQRDIHENTFGGCQDTDESGQWMSIARLMARNAGVEAREPSSDKQCKVKRLVSIPSLLRC